MFAEKLSQISETPYSNIVNSIVWEAVSTVKSECQYVANQGGRHYEELLKANQGYHEYAPNVRALDFGNYIEYGSPLYNVPKSEIASILNRVKEAVEKELKKEGFKNILVEIVQKGPFYDNKFICGRKSIFKNKSNPKYSKKIKISVSW